MSKPLSHQSTDSSIDLSTTLIRPCPIARPYQSRFREEFNMVAAEYPPNQTPSPPVQKSMSGFKIFAIIVGALKSKNKKSEETQELDECHRCLTPPGEYFFANAVRCEDSPIWDCIEVDNTEQNYGECVRGVGGGTQQTVYEAKLGQNETEAMMVSQTPDLYSDFDDKISIAESEGFPGAIGLDKEVMMEWGCLTQNINMY